MKEKRLQALCFPLSMGLLSVPTGKAVHTKQTDTSENVVV